MRTKKGTVTAAKMTGTITVTVHRYEFHPLYGKRFRKSTKFLADPNGLDVHVGDLVRIAECRPLSKRKHFRVEEILRQAPRVGEVQEESAIEETTHREKVGADAAKKEAEETKEAKESKETKESKESPEPPASPEQSNAADS